MWNVPNKKRLAKIPAIQSGVDILDKIVYLHFFVAGCDWFIVEYDGEDTFFGYAILNADLQNAEFGNIPFSQLKDIKIKGALEIDCEHERYFKPRPIREVEALKHLIPLYDNTDKTQIKFEGIDSWNRPVFKDVNSKKRFGSVNTLFDDDATEEEVLAKITEFDLRYFGTAFCCEPMGNPAYNLQIIRG